MKEIAKIAISATANFRTLSIASASDADITKYHKYNTHQRRTG